MQEIFRHSEYSRVVYYRNLLEEHGIKTILRNEVISSVEPAIPVFFPNICVLDDAQVEEAVAILQELKQQHEDRIILDIECPACSEVNPDSFDLCYSCGSDLALPSTGPQ